jgi:hypothetical protein
VKEPHSGCLTHWKIPKSGLNKLPERIQLIESMHQIDRRRTNKKKVGTREAEEPGSAEIPCPFPGYIPFPCARTRARRRTWTPGAGGRGRGTAVPRRKRFTTRGRRKAHRSLKFLDVPDQPRRRVRDTLPPSSQDGSHMIDRSEPNSRMLVAKHGLSTIVQKWELLGTELRRQFMNSHTHVLGEDLPRNFPIGLSAQKAFSVRGT